MRTFALLSVRARGHKAANKERWLGFEERQRSFAPSCSRLYCRQGYYSKNELKKRFLPNDLRNWIDCSGKSGIVDMNPKIAERGAPLLFFIVRLF